MRIIWKWQHNEILTIISDNDNNNFDNDNNIVRFLVPVLDCRLPVMIGIIKSYLVPGMHPYLVAAYQSGKIHLKFVLFLVYTHTKLPLTGPDSYPKISYHSWYVPVPAYRLLVPI